MPAMVPSKEAEGDELGAHVSAAGGADKAPERAREIGARVFQLFTKQPSRWAEPRIAPETAARFKSERIRIGTISAGSHDSYLINLASPDAALRTRSVECFQGELERARLLGLDWVVTHPGNATDGDLASGIARNADGLVQAMERVEGHPTVLLELTAGAGTSVGGSFTLLSGILEALPGGVERGVGVCIDTCHAWVAGYDLATDYDGVWRQADDAFGLARIGLFHLNDAKAPFGSHLDRHENIGDGTLGLEPFRSLMNDERFRSTPKLLETPKGDDPVAADCRNLETLRRLRTASP